MCQHSTSNTKLYCMKFKTFLINLERSPHRLADAKAQLDSLGVPFERVNAADGKSLSEEEVRCFDRDKAKKRYHYDLTWGEIGCYLSHIRCWQRIVQEKLDYAVILEDDQKLHPDFSKALDAIPKLTTEWSFIKLGNPFKTRKETAVETKDGYSLVRYNKPPSGAGAQVVTYEAAKKLLAARATFFRPVDVDFQWQWEVPINILGLTPYVAGHNLDFDSDIQNVEQRKKKKKRTLVRWKEHIRFFFYSKTNW